jgi:hypothetical protein
MATKLKRSLFIGIGGTGMKSILKTKQLYQDEYGKVPEVIGFLGVDTSNQEFEKFTRTEDDRTVKLDAQECVRMLVRQPHAYYAASKDSFDWIPKRNVSALEGLKGDGAGQIRTNGRFSFTINYHQIEAAIRQAIDRISAATNDGKGLWELADGQLQIYMVFSMSGGTGCGSFINIAYLIKDILGEDGCVLSAYAVLPNAFKGCGTFVGANAYGALLDLDYIMKTTEPDNPYTITLLKESRSYPFLPFDLVYLIDNKNDFGDIYTESRQLYTMIGQALLAVSGSIGSAAIADLDNFKQSMIDGSLDIEDKKSWICGMGLCEILVNTRKLGKKYSLKAGSKIVTDLMGSSDVKFVEELTDAFIASNKFKEHNADELLDSLYNLETEMPESAIINRRADAAETESDSFITDTLNQARRRIEGRYNERLLQVKQNFSKTLDDVTKGPKGLSGAATFIDVLVAAINLYSSEMKAELLDPIGKNAPGLKAAVKDAIQELRDKPLLKKAEPYMEAIAEAQKEYVKNEIERIRHEKADQFFLELKNFVTEKKQAIRETKERLEAVNISILDDLAKLSYTKDVNPFQIDLAADWEVDGTNDPDATIINFSAKLENKDVLSLHELTSNEIKDKVLAFTSKLSKADFEDLSISDIIMGYPEEKKKKLFEDALRKAQIVLEIRPNGYNNENILRNAIYVSAHEGDKSAIANDSIILPLLQTATAPSKPVFSDVPNTKSIMLFRQKGVYPVFQVAAIEPHKNQYELLNERRSFSFDAGLESRLEELRWSFMPNVSAADETVLEMWVKGLIHGYIKRDGMKYLVQSATLSNGDFSNDGWVKLKGAPEGEGTEARHYAFEDFKSKKKFLKSRGDLLSKIKAKEQELGLNATTTLYQQVRACSANEYVERYSAANVKMETINNSLSYQKTKSVINDELNYIKNKLVESLTR